jgi:hypothetical protein
MAIDPISSIRVGSKIWIKASYNTRGKNWFYVKRNTLLKGFLELKSLHTPTKIFPIKYENTCTLIP